MARLEVNNRLASSLKRIARYEGKSVDEVLEALLQLYEPGVSKAVVWPGN